MHLSSLPMRDISDGVVGCLLQIERHLARPFLQRAHRTRRRSRRHGAARIGRHLPERWPLGLGGAWRRRRTIEAPRFGRGRKRRRLRNEISKKVLPRRTSSKALEPVL